MGRNKGVDLKIIKLAKGFYIHFTVFILFFLSFIFDFFYITAIAFLTALCHELFHLAAILYLKEKCSAISIMPYGCRLSAASPKSPAHEILIAASGPFFNLLCVLIFKEGPLYDANLSMLIINLLPIMPLDGGRILNGFLVILTGPFKAAAISRKLSIFLGVFFFALGTFAAFTVGFNLSVFISGIFLLSSALCDSPYQRLYVSAVTNSGEKLSKGPLKGTDIVAYSDTPARKIIPLLPINSYGMITVLDKKGKALLRISEQQLTDSVKEEGARITLMEIVLKNG